MLGRITRTLSLGGAFVAAAIVATPSQAMPAFARQTGKACMTCHFQHFPALNEYGMEFKAGGYVDMGKQAEVKGKELSLPGIFNASLYTKVRYQKTNGKDGNDQNGNPVKTTHSGEIQFPDEFALLIGGRVSENIGFMIENQFAGGGTGILAGFKLPMMFPVGSGMKLGVVPFLTDALGVGYGFENLNTGAVRNVRVSEHRNETSAHQYVFFGGTGPANQDPAAADGVTGATVRATAGAASGLSFVLWDPQFFVNYTRWTPHHLAEAGSNVGGLGAGYLRAAWTPTFGDWSLGLGIQSYHGTGVRMIGTDATATAVPLTVDTKGTAIDFQAQGSFSNMPLGIYLTHATAPGNGAKACGNAAVVAGGYGCNLFNSNPNARRATVILAELGVIPNKAAIQLAYRAANTGTANAADGGRDNAWTLGGTYQLTQNVQFQLAHSTRTNMANGTGRVGVNCSATTTGGAAGCLGNLNPTTPGSSLTTLMLSAGF